jgi:hypothetical protein
MGLLGWIEGKEKTLYEDIKAFFLKVSADEPQIEKAVATTLAVAAPLVGTIVTLAAGEPAAAAVATVIADVQTELANVQTTITSAGSAPTVTAALNAIVANLKSLLTGALIKNPTTLSKVSTVATTVIGEVEAIISDL